MNFAHNRWMGLGLSAAMISVAGLTSCGNEQSPVEAAPAVAAETHAGHDGEGGDGEGEGSFARIDALQALPTEKRLAFMSGHVEAGLALYRAGAPDQAAKHLLHPVSEAHAAERAGLDALGFKPGVFEQVSAALEAGKPAAEVEPLLVEAQENIASMRAAAGGEPKGLIEYLMLTLADEYDAGVDDGVIVNAGEYQDAYGFAVVARDIALAQDPAVYGALRTELDMLVLMWPGKGPLADSNPAPDALMAAALERVKLAVTNLP